MKHEPTGFAHLYSTDKKEWTRLYRKAQRKKKPEMFHAQARRQYDNKKRWLKENPERARKIRRRSGLMQRYGLTEQEYQKMFESQEGHCVICGRSSKLKLAVDHDHKTGKVRQLLCQPCNAGMGSFGDNPDRLRAAIVYLDRHRLRQLYDPAASRPVPDQQLPDA